MGVQIKTPDFKLQHTDIKRNYGGQIETQDLEFKATGIQILTKQFAFELPIRLCA